jgi:hypothetical protein
MIIEILLKFLLLGVAKDESSPCPEAFLDVVLKIGVNKQYSGGKCQRSCLD